MCFSACSIASATVPATCVSKPSRSRASDRGTVMDFLVLHHQDGAPTRHGVKGRRAGAPGPSVVVATAAVAVIVATGVHAAGAGVVHPVTGCRARAARVVGVLGLVARARDVHAALRGSLSGRSLARAAGVVGVLGLVTRAG